MGLVSRLFQRSVKALGGFPDFAGEIFLKGNSEAQGGARGATLGDFFKKAVKMRKNIRRPSQALAVGFLFCQGVRLDDLQGPLCP